MKKYYKIFLAFVVSIFTSESKGENVPMLNKNAMNIKKTIVKKYNSNNKKSDYSDIITYYDDKHNLDEIVNLSEELK